MGRLKNKVALVTGDPWGVPLATIKLFVEEGGHVFAMGIDQQHLNDAIKTVGKNVIAVPGDASNVADLDRLYKTVKKERGWIDIVFANPVSTKRFARGATTKEEHELNYNNRVRAPFFTIQKALPLLLDGGSIILNTFLADSRGPVPSSVDRGTTAALRSLGRAWAADLKCRRIRVNAVNPGPVDTPSRRNDLQARTTAERQRSEMTSKSAQHRRLGAVEQVAEAVVFLASEDSRHITETELSVENISIFQDFPLGGLGTPEEIAKAVVFLASDASSHITGEEWFVGAGFAHL
jgi:NAD(P)-dependent dehydrogenase (short-subunit alcohol dehydrogenase family)